MSHYRFFDEFTIKTEGEGKAIGLLQDSWSFFETEQNHSPNLIIKSVDQIVSDDNSAILGGLRENYSQSGGYLVEGYYGEKIAVDFHENTILLTKNVTDTTYLRTLAEYFLRKYLIESHSMVMVHASAASFEGTAFVFPAWRHAGKTNTVLTLLEQGGGYLADDRLFVNNKGEAFAFPTPLHLSNYNYAPFSGMVEESKTDEYRSKLSYHINRYTDKRSSTFMRGVNLLSRTLLTNPVEEPIHELLPSTDIITKSEVERIMVLENVESSDVKITNIDRKKFCREMEAINYLEWDKEIEERTMVHDALARDERLVSKELRGFLDSQSEIFGEIYDNTDVVKLQLPREEAWTEEMKDELIKTVYT